MHYRKLWKQINGPIARDKNGFSYEIHHIDGNHNNNELSNLQLVTIKEHLDIHLKQEDWFAAAIIAKRLGLGSDYSSSLQRGKKRPGIGGVPKGTVPWNKGIPHSQKTKDYWSKIRKGNRYAPLRISDEKCLEIIKLHENKPKLKNELVGKVTRNGKILSYETAFSVEYCSKYGVSATTIRNILNGKRSVIKKQQV